MWEGSGYSFAVHFTEGAKEGWAKKDPKNLEVFGYPERLPKCEIFDLVYF
jgi:hypothetical protein